MNDEKEVVKLKEVEVEPPAPAHRPLNPHYLWEQLVGSLRTALQAKRHDSPMTDPIPGPTMELGTDRYGNILVPALRGRYAVDEKTKEPRFAYDANGLLSFGQKKPKRLKRHWNKKQLAMKSFAIETFRADFLQYEATVRDACAKAGKEFTGVDEQAIPALAAKSTKHAMRVFERRRLFDRKTRRDIKRASRRVNFGLVPGNVDRRAHAAV